MNHASLLVTWHANPLSAAEATRLARQAEYRLQQNSANHYTCFITTLMQLVADWWTQQIGRNELERAFIDAISRRQLALAHLVVGQLLMSRKMSEAMVHLNKGLSYADGLIRHSDYFTVYNRHEDLTNLVFSKEGQQAQALEVLLNETRVIQQLDRGNIGLKTQDWPTRFSIP